VVILRTIGELWSNLFRWETLSYFEIQAQNKRAQKGTHARMVNQNHGIVVANIFIEEDCLQDWREVALFADRGWEPVQGYGAVTFYL
jgi:hypothetical protein